MHLARPSRRRPATAETYRALGTEPFWNIAIGDGRIVYSTPEPAERLDLPAPTAGSTPGGGRRYRDRPLSRWTSARAGRCSDGMSDYEYPDTVRVTLRGRRPGAGGLRRPGSCRRRASPIRNWLITDHRRRDPAPARPITCSPSRRGRLSGQAGCNRFSGSYTEASRVLTAGAIMATRMACPRDRGWRTNAGSCNCSAGRCGIAIEDGRTLVLAGNGVTVRL